LAAVALLVSVVSAVTFAGTAADWHPAPAAAQSDPSVRAEPEWNPVALDDEFDVFIFIEGAEDLAAFQFTLEYDDAYLEYMGVDIGPFLGTSGREVITLGPDVVPGSVTFAALLLPAGSQPGASGAGDLAVVRFKAIALGETTLDLTEVLLETSAGERSEVEGIDAALTIYDVEATPTEGVATPTPTPSGWYLIYIPRTDKGV
jgi:hypothetical protein